MASLMLKCVALALGGSYVESRYGPPPNAAGPLGLSTYAGLTPLIFTYMWLVEPLVRVLGGQEGEARSH
jgi:hypothetical protein